MKKVTKKLLKINRTKKNDYGLLKLALSCITTLAGLTILMYGSIATNNSVHNLSKFVDGNFRNPDSQYSIILTEEASKKYETLKTGETSTEDYISIYSNENKLKVLKDNCDEETLNTIENYEKEVLINKHISMGGVALLGASLIGTVAYITQDNKKTKETINAAINAANAESSINEEKSIEPTI